MSHRIKSRYRVSSTSAASVSPGTWRHARRLHFEALESRRLLAMFPVTNLLDGVVNASGDLPGSLRQAVFDANATIGADTIAFDPSLFSSPQVISLQFGDLEITEAVTLSVPVPDRLVIDAQLNSRIFNFTAAVGDFTIEGLTLANGQTTADNGLFQSLQNGGAIRSLTSGLLTLTNSTVTGSRTEGDFADGGGIYAKGDVLLSGSTISSNKTFGQLARGGGLFTKGSLSAIEGSVITGNTTGKVDLPSTFGDGAIGGGAVSLGDIILANSTISDNGTFGNNSYGGGLFTSGTVTITDSDVQNNFTEGSRSAGGGVFALDGVSVTRSTVSGNQTRAKIDVIYDIPYDNVGGGIRAGGDLVVDSSTISRNLTQGQASSGGGLFSLGNVELRNSTLSGNRVVSPGKIVVYYGQGGPHGRYVDSSANGGGLFAYGSVTVTNSTIYGNSVNNFGGRGGGLAAYGPVTIANSIVSGNSDNALNSLIGVDNFRYIGSFGTQNPDIRAAGGQLSASYSLIGDIRGTALDSANPGTNILNEVARLMPLSDNGGPTLTHVLRFDSPAIDGGDPNFAAPPNEDQRGANRVLGGRIDIGAYERDLFDPVIKVVDILVDEIDSNVLAGDLSLREALSFSPVGAEPLFVMFAPSLAGGTILLTLGELVIDSPTVLIGFPENYVIVDAQNNSSVIRIDASAGQVELRGMKLTNGRANLQGGGIYSLLTGSLTVEDSEISSSYAETTGGGIYAAGDLALANSTITGNNSAGKGGGIYSRGGVALKKSSMVKYNQTSGFGSHGGGIYALGDVMLDDSMVENNETYGNNSDGGGISSAGDVTLSSSTIKRNRADGNGGGVSANNVLAINTYIEDNYANADGGGINAANDVVLTRSSVNFNEAGDDGGGVHAGANVSINNSGINNNEAATSGNGNGGGVSANSVFAQDSRFDSNRVSSSLSTSGKGGGISATNVSIKNTTIEFNEASGDGGGISASNVTIEKSTISNNEGEDGGGIRATNSVEITNSSVFSNVADGDGGGLFASNVLLTGSTVSENTARGSGAFDIAVGGGIYSDGPVTIRSSTISGNEVFDDGAGAGIFVSYNSFEDVNIEFSTIFNNQGASGTNGAGLFLGRRISSINIRHSIISGNTAAGDAADIRGSRFGVDLVSYYSLLGTVTDISVSGPVISSNDPRLEPLAFNGGPTRTHAPQSGSPIVDAGASFFFADLDFDQRGTPFDRVVGGRIDIGAYETQVPAPDPLLVNTESDGAMNGFLNVSLREAIEYANTTSGPQTITFDPLFFGIPRTIQLFEGELPISDDITIVGPGQSLLTIDARNGNNGIFGDGDGWRIFNIDDGDLNNLFNVTLSGLTLSGGDTSGSGGAILNKESLSIGSSTISGNSSNGLGGGVFSFSGTLNINNTTISNNTAVDGGGVFNQIYGSTLTITDSTISGNIAADDGGGISNAYGNAYINNSTISGNTASSRGSSLFNSGTTSITSSTVSSTTDNGSSGIFSSPYFGATLSVDSTIVTGSVNGLLNGSLNLFSAVSVNITGTNNVLNTNPLLAPLADNGGPTLTHLPLPGSPAINAGDPSVLFSPTEFDQRGDPFARVSGGRIDIGAVEVPSGNNNTVVEILVVENADFDADGDVDGNDFLIWQRGFGTQVPNGTESVGDADGDTGVDGADLVIWGVQFSAGTTSAVISQAVNIALPAELIAATQESLPPSLVDAAIALDLFQQSVWPSSSPASKIPPTPTTIFEVHSEPVQFPLLPAVDRFFSVFAEDGLVFEVEESDFHEEQSVDAHLFDVAVRSLL